jgi:hypothetical protein
LPKMADDKRSLSANSVLLKPLASAAMRNRSAMAFLMVVASDSGMMEGQITHGR